MKLYDLIYCELKGLCSFCDIFLNIRVEVGAVGAGAVASGDALRYGSTVDLPNIQ
jgi:hypothetical protein